MNELEEYAASLPAPLNRDARIKLIEQWKIDNNWGEEKPQPAEVENITYGGEPVQEILETVKTRGDAAGADVAPAQTTAPTNTDFGGGIGSSELAKKAKNFNVTEFVYGNEITASSEDLKQAEDFIQKEEQEVQMQKDVSLETEQIFNKAIESKGENWNIYGSKKDTEQFSQEVFNSFINENQTIQKDVIPKATKEAEAVTLSYIEDAKERYKLNDPETYTQENFDAYLEDVNSYYNNTVNKKIGQNKEFISLTGAFDKKMQSLSKDYNLSTIRKANQPSILGYDLPEGGIAEKLYRGFVNIFR